MTSTKIIKDPIHNFIEFKGDFEQSLLKILDTKHYQRLRRVKQLGFTDLTFPSATHSRFSHSLGVYHLAKKLLSKIPVEQNGLTSGEWSKKAKAAIAAALLHDIGHGMFSHAFEAAIKSYIEKNPTEKAKFELLCDHEEITKSIIISSEISGILNDIDTSLAADVIDIIAKKKKNCVYTSIVTSQLDADRMDYSKRDPFFAGVSSNGYDLEWILENTHYKEVEEKSFLYVKSKAQISLEQYTVNLFHLYPTIYLHKKTRGLEVMLSELLGYVFDLISKNHTKETGLDPENPIIALFNDPSNIDVIQKMDDSLFWTSIHQMAKASDENCKRISQKLLNRQIYKEIDIWKIAEKHIYSSESEENIPATRRVEIIDNNCKKAIEELKRNPRWTSNFHYDNYDRPIYKPKNIKGGSPEQINVQIGDEIMDIAVTSPIVASAATFNIHRIHYDEKFDNEAQVINRELDIIFSDLFKSPLN